MTFRPSDDVLEEMADSQQTSSSLNQYYNGAWNQWEWSTIFHTTDDFDNQWNSQQNTIPSWGDSPNIDINNANVVPTIDIQIEPMEEVKAPDLSELLKMQDEGWVSEENLASDTNSVGDTNPEWDNSNEDIVSTEDTNNVSNLDNVESSNNVERFNNIENVNNIEESNDTKDSNNIEELNNVETPNVNNSEENQVDTVTWENEQVKEDNTEVDNQWNWENNQSQNSPTEPEAPIQDAQVLEQQSSETEEVVNPDATPLNGVNDANKPVITPWTESNWKLNFLVDWEQASIIKKYKKIHRILFRWWIFILVLIAWGTLWAFAQVKFGNAENIEIIKEDSVEKWKDKNSSENVWLSGFDNGTDVNIIVPYGVYSANKQSFKSKSNLVSYKGIILPQSVFIDSKSNNLISLEDFNNNKATREDLENILNILVLDGVIEKTAELSSISPSGWKANTFEWTLTDGFNLWCLDKDKVSDFVCDQFLWIFYDYGKYYDLWKYSSEVLMLMKKLKSQHKNFDPLCEMVKEYTEHSWVSSSEALQYTMEYCSESDQQYYKKLTNFIEVENSLSQPEISDKVFEDPDLNAYKLLSVLQYLYNKSLRWSSNENYIKSYLDYVQALVNKDKGSNRILKPLYKDLLYVFNSDYLYPFLEKSSMVTLKLKVDEINNWNAVYWYSSLLDQLTTANIIKSGEIFTGDVENEISLDDILAKYYSMTDRLKIRRVVQEDDWLVVQTELFTNKILSATKGETLKITAKLNRKGNTLYVSNIKITWQSKLTDILNIKAAGWNVTFDAMLPYIDEQISMWYKTPESEEKITICDELRDREDLNIYSCDEYWIILYKWDIEYDIVLSNWILDSFTISDENLESLAKIKLGSVMSSSDNTTTLIKYILDLEAEVVPENIEDKINVIDQFRIHFKLVPEVKDSIEWEDGTFLVEFALGEFDLQAHYNINTHLLTKISYVACEKTLEIKNLTIELSTENEPKLAEILNNPKVFFVQTNPAAYKKYQKMCDDATEKSKQ